MQSVEEDEPISIEIGVTRNTTCVVHRRGERDSGFVCVIIVAEANRVGHSKHTTFIRNSNPFPEDIVYACVCAQYFDCIRAITQTDRTREEEEKKCENRTKC